MRRPTQPASHGSDLCCDDAIVRLLANDLDEAKLHDLEHHLESCERCCERLATLTAEGSFWNDTQSILSSVDELPNLDFSLDLSACLWSDQQQSDRPPTIDIPLQPTDDPEMLGRFGGHEICAVIGRGGMGVVLKGWDRTLDRYVAIKVLSPSYSHQPAARQRFAREAKAAASIVHDNVVAIHGVDQCLGLPYLVMPYVKGESLQKRIDRKAPLTVEEILEISMQISRGLQAAHDQGVIHRDIKPANILLPHSVTRVQITDFGLARAADDATLTNTGTIAGTPAYMSPEQARGDAVDASTDLFSLGCVIYAMTCGKPPFQAESSYGILRAIIEDPHQPLCKVQPDVPKWFSSIVDRLLSKKPQNRFESAGQLTEHLELCLAHVRQPATHPLPRMLTHSRRLRVAVAAVVISVVSLFTWTQFLDRSAMPSRPPAATHAFNDDVWSDIDDELIQLERLFDDLNQEMEK